MTDPVLVAEFDDRVCESCSLLGGVDLLVHSAGQQTPAWPRTASGTRPRGTQARRQGQGEAHRGQRSHEVEGPQAARVDAHDSQAHGRCQARGARADRADRPALADIDPRKCASSPRPLGGAAWPRRASELKAAKRLEELADRCEKVARQLKQRVDEEPIQDRLISLGDPTPARSARASSPSPTSSKPSISSRERRAGRETENAKRKPGPNPRRVSPPARFDTHLTAPTGLSGASS